MERRQKSLQEKYTLPRMDHLGEDEEETGSTKRKQSRPHRRQPVLRMGSCQRLRLAHGFVVRDDRRRFAFRITRMKSWRKMRRKRSEAQISAKKKKCCRPKTKRYLRRRKRKPSQKRRRRKAVKRMFLTRQNPHKNRPTDRSTTTSHIFHIPHRHRRGRMEQEDRV